MRSRKFILALIACLLIVAPAAAALTTTVKEDFSGTLADATWRLGTLDQIDSTGGNPGAFLHNPELDSAVPTPVYVGPLPSPFFGNYRAANVVSLGLDVKVFAASFGVDASRPISLVLSSDMGTPSDPTDDCDAYVVGTKPVPRPGTAWRSYEFRVPSSVTGLPPRWQIRGTCAGLSNDDAWNALIQNVTHVSFPFADPGTFWFFQVWDLGIDNVHITFRNLP